MWQSTIAKVEEGKGSVLAGVNFPSSAVISKSPGLQFSSPPALQSFSPAAPQPGINF